MALHKALKRSGKMVILDHDPDTGATTRANATLTGGKHSMVVVPRLQEIREFTLAGFQLTDRNGTYVKSQEAVNGMPEFQRKDGRDYWICYYPPGKMWVMQSQIHKGTCDSMAVTIAGDNAPWDEASRWKESNSSACNEWHSNDLIQQWTLSSVRVLSETDLALRGVLAEAAVSPSPIRYNAHY